MAEKYNPKAKIIVVQHGDKKFNLIQERNVIGGTKTRGIYLFIKAKTEYIEFVYAGPATGNAQYALAYCCYLLKKKATVFLSSAPANRDTAPTTNALKYGVNIAGKYVSLAEAQDAATRYCNENPGRFLCPFGLYDPDYIAILKKSIKAAFPDTFSPHRMWITVGSGTVLSALVQLFPKTLFCCVLVGRNIWQDQYTKQQWKRLTIYRAPEKFVQNAEFPPPYKSLKNYDAKAWRFIRDEGQDGDYIWNVY